jgi:hypothetical protein
MMNAFDVMANTASFALVFGTVWMWRNGSYAPSSHLDQVRAWLRVAVRPST